MELFLSYLQDYNGAFTMLAVIIVALVSHFSYRSILKNIKEVPKPYVVLYLTKLNHDESVNYFVMENFGKVVANNIKVTMYPELQIEYPRDNPIELFFEYPISFLAPSQKIMSALPAGDYTDRRYDCTLTYQGDKGESYSRTQTIDFTYTKYLLFSASPENKIAKNTEKIYQSLDDILTKLPRQI